jgi:hypothetical protein
MFKPAVAVYLSGAAFVATVPAWLQDVGVYTSVFVGVVGALLLVGRHVRILFLFLEREVIHDAREALAPELAKLSDAISDLTDRVAQLETNQTPERP